MQMVTFKFFASKPAKTVYTYNFKDWDKDLYNTEPIIIYDQQLSIILVNLNILFDFYILIVSGFL